MQDNKQARKAYEKWGGKLDAYSQPYVKEGKEYVEVFYTFDLTKEKKLEEKKHEIDFKWGVGNGEVVGYAFGHFENGTVKKDRGVFKCLY